MRCKIARAIAALTLLLAPVVAWTGEGFTDELERAMAAQDELARRGEVEEMLAQARSGARSGSPDAWYLLGRALGNAAIEKKRGGDDKAFGELIGEAREAFETAQELGGLLYEPAFLGLARCSRFEGDLARAERDLRQALRVAPGFVPAALELAQVLWERGLRADAELELHRLLEKHPDDVDARMLLGSLKMYRKRWGEAEREFRTVVAKAADNLVARKLLATTLMFQQKLQESAQHWEALRAALPEEEESYISLFEIYKGLADEVKAREVLAALVVALPDTEAATRARNTLQAMDDDPEYFRGRGDDEVSAERLVERVEQGDDAARVKGLQAMREFEWDALPGIVYRLLSPKDAPPPVRVEALRLIGVHGDPRTVPLIEILLFHPKERDPDAAVRRAAADALSRIASDAAVPMLLRLLSDADVDVREAGVRGLAARTGKWFRADLAVVTPVTEWPAELECYRGWWDSPSGGIAKRRAVEAMVGVFGHLRRGRARLAGYALDAMDDASERTWAAGYALFRAMTDESFGSETGRVGDEEERRRIAEAARRWVSSHGDEED